MAVGVSFQKAAKAGIIPWNGPSALSSEPKGRSALKFIIPPSWAGLVTPEQGPGGVRQALKKLCCGPLKETPTAQQCANDFFLNANLLQTLRLKA